MIKLRTLLLHNYPFYIIMMIALLYFFIYSSFDFKSNITDLQNCTCRITNIIIKDYGFKIDCKLKHEKTILYYYAKSKEIDDLYNNYRIGDYIRVSLLDVKITNNTLPNTFNYKKNLYYKKIYRVFNVTSIEKVKKNRNIFYFIKDILYRRSYKLPFSYPYINTLLFGNKTDMDSDVLDSFRSIGISHLFAISGTHISIFIFILEELLKKIRVKEYKRAKIIILFLLFFMFLTNFSMSVCRCSLFTIFSIINDKYYFYIKPVNLLLLSLAIIIFFNPFNLFDIGLLYSFFISLALIICTNYINKSNNFITKSLKVSLISFIVSFPITINSFYEVNFLSIIYNLFFVPFVSFIILPLVIMGYTFPFFDKLLYLFVLVLEKVSLFLKDINLFKVIMCKPSMSINILYIVSIIIFIFGILKEKKSYKFFIIIPILLNFLGTLKNKDRIMFIDVLQGDSILLTVNGSVTLIDTGGVLLTNTSKYTSKFAKNRIIPYLKSIGIRKIDNLILTHGDSDHMGDSIYLVNNFKIDNIYINSNKLNYLENKLIKASNLKKIPVKKLYKSNIIDLNGIKLYSLNKNNNDENSSSIVLYLNMYNKKMLFTGDIPKSVEEDLINNYDLSSLYILKLAHHGSNTSSSYDFLRVTNPKYSIISASFNNKYNHPSKETIDSLNKLNLTYFETSKYGSIIFDLKSGTKTYYMP